MKNYPFIMFILVYEFWSNNKSEILHHRYKIVSEILESERRYVKTLKFLISVSFYYYFVLKK